MKVKILKNKHFQTEKDFPQRGTKDSSGYDIVATSNPNIIGEVGKVSGAWDRVDYIEYDTNLHISPDNRCYRGFSEINPKIGNHFCYFDTLVFPRSSISKTNLILANSIGLIDNDYRNSIKLRFKYIFQPEDFYVINNGVGSHIEGYVNYDKIYKKGQKIGQLKFSQVIDAEFELVDELTDTERGKGGFGSTGE